MHTENRAYQLKRGKTWVKQIQILLIQIIQVTDFFFQNINNMLKKTKRENLAKYTVQWQNGNINVPRAQQLGQGYITYQKGIKVLSSFKVVGTKTLQAQTYSLRQ